MMKCIAIDDEPLALNIIKDYAEKIPFLSLEAVFINAIEASSFIVTNVIDLVFLDIQMPHITGLDFIKTLSKPPLIIFTTAYSEFAVTGFEVDAVDYLLKPFSFERFFKAVQKANERFTFQRGREKNNNKIILQKSTKDLISDYIMVRSDYSIVKIELDKIRYIEGLKDYVKIYWGQARPLLSKITMKNLEQQLSSNNFIRVHKSYIISIKYMDSIDNNRIKIGDKYIPIGNQYRKNFFDKINKKSL